MTPEIIMAWGGAVAMCLAVLTMAGTVAVIGTVLLKEIRS